jgi:hypothetical protein
MAKVDPETMQRWVGRAQVAFKMWTWLKTSAKLMLADPSRIVSVVKRGQPIAQMTALLTALFAILLVGHIGSLF